MAKFTATDEFLAARADAKINLQIAEGNKDHADADISTVLLTDVLSVWDIFGIDGIKDNGNLNLTVRGASSAYAEAMGISRGQVSKCLTILYVFSDRRAAGETGVKVLVAEHGPSLNDIYDAARAELQGDEGDDEGETLKTLESDLAPIIKRWAKRDVGCDEMIARATAAIMAHFAD